MPAAGPITFKPETFKIVQLNAENLFLFFDESLDRDLRKMSEKEWQKLSRAVVPNKALLKTLWLADSLLTIDADIVGVNEVGGLESLSNFAKFFLQDRYTAHLIEGNSDRGIDIGFLVKKDFKLGTELRSHKNRPLGFLYPHEEQSNAYYADRQPEKVIRTHYFSRDCAELRLQREGDTKPRLIVLLLHLKSKLDPDGIDPEGRNRRAAELRTACEIYRELRTGADAGVPLIVMGDFNGNARRQSLAEEFAELKKTDLESLTDILAFDDVRAATQIQFNRSGQIQYLQIDYIFISPELKEHVIPEGVEVFRYHSDLKVPLPLPTTLDQRLALPSDHYPLIATFKNFF
jgi:endonuclease/exonuclease/phosphatase family metal-dependent hydrolase